MEPRIIRANTLNERKSDERCLIAENWRSGKMSVARATVNPGVTTMLHNLEGIDEIYIIVRGRGAVKIGDIQLANVKEGDTIFIPAGTDQQITNIGKSNLVFYCICTPPFNPSCYHSKS